MSGHSVCRYTRRLCCHTNPQGISGLTVPGVLLPTCFPQGTTARDAPGGSAVTPCRRAYPVSRHPADCFLLASRRAPRRAMHPADCCHKKLQGTTGLAAPGGMRDMPYRRALRLIVPFRFNYVCIIRAHIISRHPAQPSHFHLPSSRTAFSLLSHTSSRSSRAAFVPRILLHSVHSVIPCIFMS